MSSQFECLRTNYTAPTEEHLLYSVYYVLLPFYFVIGLASNIVLLLAFYRRSKREQPYVYQVLLTTSKTLEILTFGSFLFGLHWFSGIFSAGSGWFQQQYWLMFLTLRIGPWGHVHFIISSLLLSVAMSGDRVLALSRPFAYKGMNHSKHQVTSAVFCFGIPLFSSLVYGWFFKIEEIDRDHYVGSIDNQYITNPLVQFFGQLGVTIRVLGVLSLIGLNLLMAIKFRRQHEKIGQMTNNAQKQEITRIADKTLCLLNAYQSVLMCANQIPHTLFHLIRFAAPSFSQCYDGIMMPVGDGCIMITDSIDILVILLINKKMRGMIWNGLRCSRSHGNQVSHSDPISGGHRLEMRRNV